MRAIHPILPLLFADRNPTEARRPAVPDHARTRAEARSRHYTLRRFQPDAKPRLAPR
jgi:hypothetical protein